MRLILSYFLLLHFGLFSSAVAQRLPPEAAERHAKRVLGLGNISFINSFKPTSTIGGLYQVSVRKWTVIRSMKPDSLVAKIDGALQTKLGVGFIHRDIRNALRSQFFNISNDATVKDSSGVWVLTNRRDRYLLKMDTDSVSVFTSITSQEIGLPRFYFHLLGSGSLNGEDDYRALGQLGVMRRNASAFLTAVGVVAQGAMPVKGIAPLIRLEILDVLALQGGPSYYEGTQWGYYISVDFMKGLWTDIGLK